MSTNIVSRSRRKSAVVFSSIAFLALLLSPIVAGTTMMSPNLAYASHDNETVEVQEGQTLRIEDVECATDPPGLTIRCEVVEQPPGSRVEGGGTGPSPMTISLIWENAGPPGTYQAVFRTTCVDEDCGDAQGQSHDKTVTIEVLPRDTDGDGIGDSTDECPTEPETVNQFEDTDGCPDEAPPEEEDTDGDGIPDNVDQCPNQPETVNQFEDTDGCPDEAPPEEEDTDGDGIPDNVDQCDNRDENFNDFQDEDGCPDTSPSESEEINRRIEQERERIEQARQEANRRAQQATEEADTTAQQATEDAVTRSQQALEELNRRIQENAERVPRAPIRLLEITQTGTAELDESVGPFPAGTYELRTEIGTNIACPAERGLFAIGSERGTLEIDQVEGSNDFTVRLNDIEIAALADENDVVVGYEYDATFTLPYSGGTESGEIRGALITDEEIRCGQEYEASLSNIVATVVFDDGTATFDDDPLSAEGTLEIG